MRRLACVIALVSAACGRKPHSLPVDAAPPVPPRTSVEIVEAPAAAAADAGGDARTDLAQDGGAGTSKREYPKEGIAPLAPDCPNPQAVLGVAPYDDRSVLRRIQQAMIAHPEIEVVADEPGVRQVKLSESQYGTKFFARHGVQRNRYAVIADCGDPITCLAAAAMVRAVVPMAHPELFCGNPPAISGQKEVLRGPWKLPDALPNPDDRVELCARVTACTVRSAIAEGDATWRACSKLRVKDVARCAGMMECTAVAGCFRQLGGS